METATLVSHVDTEVITRDRLALMPTPAGTDTHKTIPHIEVVNAIIETLGFRHVSVVKEEYACSKDGNKLFGVMELETTFDGCRFALGVIPVPKLKSSEAAVPLSP